MPSPPTESVAAASAELAAQASVDAGRIGQLTAQQLVDAGMGGVRPFSSKYGERVDPNVLWSLTGLHPDHLETVSEWLRVNKPGAVQRRPRRATMRHSGGKAWLEDAFVNFHRFMFDNKLLPLSKWGIGRDHWRKDRDIPSRVGVVAFLRQQSSQLPSAQHSSCLGWDDLLYVRMFANCDLERSWSFQFVERGGRRHPAVINEAKRVLKADLNSGLDAQMLGARHASFDLILCNQVFEHAARPFRAALSLFNLLRPGGHVLWTAPFIEIFHLVPGDHFRYTCPGASSAS